MSVFIRFNLQPLNFLEYIGNLTVKTNWSEWPIFPVATKFS